MDGMAQFPDGFFNLAVVDPPYGRKEHGGRNRGKFVTQKKREVPVCTRWTVQKEKLGHGNARETLF